MPLLNSTAANLAEVTGWRHDFHAHPEILYEVHRTAARVAALLTSFGIDEVATGLGRTGVVGIIHGNRPGKMIALRAEMDALPMPEETGLPHASTIPGAMHACGHDGHSAMLLGAAKHLAETRDFAGSVALIFQPAEEGGKGALAMAEDGLFDRWPISACYAMHNMPGLPLGAFASVAGGIMASADKFNMTLKATGGHAAWPHTTPDPIVCAGQIIGAVQTIVSREANPLLASVISITQVLGGSAHNVIPAEVTLAGTLRALDPGLRQRNAARLEQIAKGIAATMGVEAQVEVQFGSGVVMNDPRELALCMDVARDLMGPDMVDAHMVPLMGGDDFCYLAERRPSCYVFVGNGESAGLHTTKYDFNDDLIPIGISYWINLVQRATAS
ncbi:M20 aminoacylase family protein [Ketogulonicigenium vulgare]|uniref:M20 aminoacylase family protein n=1 Tax=Ketogulonicigenium vulgare TaxID=92945 RepID=UPI0023590855|nr:M20 aminoacylase family protein [Ketogulonicigenium vulgare]